MNRFAELAAAHPQEAAARGAGAGLPRAYAPEIYKQKCSAVFEHVYESDPQRDVGMCAVGG